MSNGVNFDVPLDNGIARGRSALSAAVGCFEPYARVAIDGGWDAPGRDVLRPMSRLPHVAIEVPRLRG